MAKWQVNNPIRYDVPPQQGGDTIYHGFSKTANEFDNIYNYLNALRTLRSGTIPPTDAEVNELWLDTSVNPPILKRWNGSSWIAIMSQTPTANTIPVLDADGKLNLLDIVTKGPLVDVRAFGAKGDGVTDDTKAIQDAINSIASTGGVVFFPKGVYIISSPLILPSHENIKWWDDPNSATKISLIGEGEHVSVIKKTTNTVGSGGNIAPSRTGIVDSYAVDSIITISHQDNVYTGYILIEMLGLVGAATNKNTYGIYAPRVAMLTVRNVNIGNVETGFLSYDIFVSRFERVFIYRVNKGIHFASDGSGKGTGTSTTLSEVSVAKSDIAYHLQHHTYSTFNSCAADDVSVSSYTFEGCVGITLNGCGTEFTPNVLTIKNSSGMVINSLFGYALKGVSGTGIYAAIYLEKCRATFNSSYIYDFITPNDSYNVYIPVDQSMRSNVNLTINNCVFPSNGKTVLNLKGEITNWSSRNNFVQEMVNLRLNDIGMFSLKDSLFDILAFRPPTSARYLSGGNWVTITPPANIFVPEIPGLFKIVNGWSEVEFIWNNMEYIYVDWIHIWGASRGNQLKIIIDASTDGTTWTNIVTTSSVDYQWPGVYRIQKSCSNLGKTPYLRMRLIPTWNNTYDIDITRIAFVGLYPRIVDPNFVKQRMPLYWDEKKNIFISGNIGIGTSAPSRKLHVVGDIRIDGTTNTTASAGTATLPSNPVGFLVVNIGGTDYKIPYYGV